MEEDIKIAKMVASCLEPREKYSMANLINRLEEDERIIEDQEKTIEQQIEEIDQLKKELLQYQDLESALQDYYGITREDIEKNIKEETLIL